MIEATDRWGYVVAVPLNNFYDPDLWDFLWHSDQEDDQEESEAVYEPA